MRPPAPCLVGVQIPTPSDPSAVRETVTGRLPR
jgi:hypothetical protein